MVLHRRPKLILVRMCFFCIWVWFVFPGLSSRKTQAERQFSSWREVLNAHTHFYDAWYLCSSMEFLGHEMAKGLNVFKSRKKRLNLEPHRPFALKSIGPFPLAVLCVKELAWSKWRVSSTSTSRQTSCKILAKVFRISFAMFHVCTPTLHTVESMWLGDFSPH